MHQQKEIVVALLSNGAGHHIVSLSVNGEQALLEIEQAGELFDKIGDALEAVGFFEEDDEVTSEVAPTCH